MIRRRLLVPVAALVLGIVDVRPAAAQQSVNLYVGGFVAPAWDSRSASDVLYQNTDYLVFDFSDFNGVTAGGEYLVALGDLFDAGLGVGIYSQTSHAVYRDFVNANGSEIEQDLKLRNVPFTATFRLLPLGHRDAIVPYVGAGIGIHVWRYRETGEFVDGNFDIYRDTFEASGTSVGPVILGGLRVPAGSVDVGGEIRWQGGEGELPASQGFSGSTIDLGGFNYLFTVNVRF